MIRCQITRRAGFRDQSAFERCLERNIAAGKVDWIQIREKDMPARELVRLVRRVVAVAAAAGEHVRVLVNSRMDVALAAGAAGLHLPSGSPEAGVFRRIAPRGFLIGVSCHNAAELRAAEEGGADYAVLGPVYAPLSKPLGREGEMGVARFGELVRGVGIPVLALGGITEERVGACIAAGAAGVAAITLFQE